MSEICEIPTRILEIIDESSLDGKEKILVAQIMHNYYVRGLLWESDHPYGVNDEVIAVTELIVMTNCLRKIHTDNSIEKTQEKT